MRCTVEHVTSDFPADAIVSAARRNRCDLIFISSHGRHGFKPTLLGSQTQKTFASDRGGAISIPAIDPRLSNVRP